MTTFTKLQEEAQYIYEYMNIVLEDAVEVSTKTGATQKLGKIMLKGDNITLISSLDLDK